MSASPEDMKRKKVDDEKKDVLVFNRRPDGDWDSLRHASEGNVPVDPSTLDPVMQRIMQTVHAVRGGHFYPAPSASSPSSSASSGTSVPSFGRETASAREASSSSATSAAPWSVETDTMFMGIFTSPAATEEKQESALLKRYQVINKEHALRKAAAAGAVKDVELAIRLGVDVNAMDGNPSSRKTALHHAESRGHHEVADVLKRAGAHDDIKDADGKTPQDYRVTQGISFT